MGKGGAESGGEWGVGRRKGNGRAKGERTDGGGGRVEG